MRERFSTRRLPSGLSPIVAAVALVAACASSGAPSAGSSVGSSAASAETSAAPSTIPKSTTTQASPSADGGPVIHVNVFVPLAWDSAPGSGCDAAALSATGPKAATIPGSPMRFAVIVDLDTATLGVIGEERVPSTGMIVERVTDDPQFPSACRFSFDVATTGVDTDRIFFSLGTIYFPMPIILRVDLEATGWVANIGVNPQ